MELYANTVAETGSNSNNVIMFPRNSSMADIPNTMEEAQAILTETRAYLANEIADEATEGAIQIMRNFGAFAKPESMPTKDIVALNETMKAILYRYYGLYHPLHDVFAEAISIEYKDVELDIEVELENTETESET